MSTKRKPCENENFRSHCVTASDQSVNPMFVNININGNDLEFEVDSGTNTTVMFRKICDEYFGNLELMNTSVNLRTYDGMVLQPNGNLGNLTVRFEGRCWVLECFVLAISRPGSIGRNW